MHYQESLRWKMYLPLHMYIEKVAALCIRVPLPCTRSTSAGARVLAARDCKLPLAKMPHGACCDCETRSRKPQADATPWIGLFHSNKRATRFTRAPTVRPRHLTPFRYLSALTTPTRDPSPLACAGRPWCDGSRPPDADSGTRERHVTAPCRQISGARGAHVARSTWP